MAQQTTPTPYKAGVLNIKKLEDGIHFDVKIYGEEDIDLKDLVIPKRVYEYEKVQTTEEVKASDSKARVYKYAFIYIAAIFSVFVIIDGLFKLFPLVKRLFNF